MANRSLAGKQLSRTKLELFLECPRCFHADIALGVSRPRQLPFSLNNAVDQLFKNEFDIYRVAQQPHPSFASVGLDAVPLAHPELATWRRNFTGVRWNDAETGWTLFGAIDDVWLNANGQVHVADYKATSRAEAITAANLYPGYQRQAEVYQFLLRQQGLAVSDTAWFVYANGIQAAPRFDNRLDFRTVLLPYEGNAAWVSDTFRKAVAQATAATPPDPSPTCSWCQYVKERQPS
jgi:hypothetical protein